MTHLGDGWPRSTTWYVPLHMSVHPRLIFREIDRITATLAEDLDAAVSEFLIDSRNEAPIVKVRSVIQKRLRRICENL